MASTAETDAMRRAIQLAGAVDLTVDRNPRVGAVVMSATGRRLAEAAHGGSGTPHAEAAALSVAGAAARGSTVVVTLEPCAHTGRTGPCTTLLADAGVRRVVYAQTDPTAQAAGGADALRRAGLDVEAGVCAAEATELNRAWTRAMSAGRPVVTWKLATTLDGRSAAADGTSRWITGPAARADVHRMRARCDSILVGTGTVVADDPRLTARGGAAEALGRSAQPLRAVMGLRELDPGRRVFDDDADSVRLRTRDPGLALRELFARGNHHVWLEGGPTLSAAFLRAGAVDQVVAYVAPALLGAGAAAVADLGITTVSDTLRLELAGVTRLGDDVRLTMLTNKSDES